MGDSTLPTTVIDWLHAFDRMSVEEKTILVKELSKRVDERVELSPIDDEELTHLTCQLFQMYEEEEQANGLA